jgi:hypothetical protein
MIAIINAQIILPAPFGQEPQIFRNGVPQIFRNHHAVNYARRAHFDPHAWPSHPNCASGA